jgi:sulfur relay (sulfurtransferase) complex TusBCD TusD component (DsrE family)
MTMATYLFILVCGTRMDARGIAKSELAPAAHKGTLEESADWTAGAAKVLVF